MKKVNLASQIFLALLAGVLVGVFTGTTLAPLSEIGRLVIQMIKVAAIPLLFLTIVNAIIQTEVEFKGGVRMVVIATMNACLALALGLILCRWLRPGTYLDMQAFDPVQAAAPGGKIELAKTLSSYIPSSILQPFVDNAVIPIVLMALLLGAGLRRTRTQARVRGTDIQVIEQLLAISLETTETILGWIIRLIPLAVFCVVVKAAGEYGLSPLRGLAAYVAVALLGLGIHVVVTYQVLVGWVARISLKEFWRAARDPVVYAMGANSSLATLPLTLKALDRLKIPKSASTLGACVGTNLNNDGIILYEAMAVLFVAQAYGLDLSLAQQVSVALLCLVAAMGVAGVPEAGFISLSLVLATTGLPVEILPLLLTVDWIIARARSVVNVLSDMVVSILIAGRERVAGGDPGSA